MSENYKSDSTPQCELADYLLSEEYRRLLYRAVAARLGTTSAHGPEHRKALKLIEVAFPELTL